MSETSSTMCCGTSNVIASLNTGLDVLYLYLCIVLGDVPYSCTIVDVLYLCTVLDVLYFCNVVLYFVFVYCIRGSIVIMYCIRRTVLLYCSTRLTVLVLVYCTRESTVLVYCTRRTVLDRRLLLADLLTSTSHRHLYEWIYRPQQKKQLPYKIGPIK